ncbi:MAG: hypothetical protein GY755_08905 [Chloroflexi bacterium]|nr:hypothetical protein [Chloroflexota bacterium]
MKFKLSLLIFFLSFALFACQPEPVPVSGDILLDDDFSTGANRWTTLVNDKGAMGYDAEGFRFYIRDPGLNYWATSDNHFKDVHIEVDSLRFSGPESNRIGIICRHRDDLNYYFFVISSDGYYAVGKVKEGEQILLEQEAMQYSESIKTGIAINHLRADCQGTSLRFYVNDVPIALVEDFDFAEGDVGLLVGTFEEGELNVIFDDFVVYQP